MMKAPLISQPSAIRTATRLVVLLLLLVGHEAAAGTIALIGGRLVDGSGAAAVEASAVVIEDRVITRVGDEAKVDIPVNALRIDTTGKTVLPGLVDTHVHFRLAGHGDYSRWEKQYPTARARTQVFPRSAVAELRAGVTSAQDLGAEVDSIFWLRDEVRQGRLLGPRISIAGPVLCTPVRAQTSSMSPADWWIVESAEDGRDKVRALAKRGVDVIKLWDDNFSDTEFAAMIGEAHAHDLRIAAHLLTVEGMYRALRNGLGHRDSIHHAGASAGSRFPDDLVDLIVSQRVYLAPTIIAFDGFRQIVEDPAELDDPAWAESLGKELYEDVRESFVNMNPTEHFLYKYAFELRQDRRSKLRQLHAAGATFVLGTDAGSRANPHHAAAWREMVLMVEEIGMSNADVIASATRLAAEVLGVDDMVGTIEPGKAGDVIVVDGNPLEDMAAMRNVELVIKDGVIVD